MRVLLVLASVLAVGMCMQGGWSEGNATDPKYRQILMDLQNSNLITAMDGSPQLIKVQEQVVSGMNYNFTLQMENTVCYIIYYTQSWTNTNEIKLDTCKANKRQVGGYSTQNATDPQYMTMLTKLATKNLITLPMDLNNMDLIGVRTQVVSGMNYEFTLRVNGTMCHIVYYEQSWTNTHNIQLDTCKANKHQLGGYSTQNATDPQYMTMLTKLATKNLITLPMDLNNTDLVGVRTQVGSGMNYEFTLRVNGTVCHIVYYEQSWTNIHEIKLDTCKADKHQVGGYSTQNVTDPQYMTMLTKLATTNLITLPMDLNNTDLVGVRTQVGSGMNYEFTLRVNGHDCQLVFYEVPWMQKQEITSDTCSTLSQKRQLVGGWSPVANTSAAGVQSCLGASLDRINSMSNSKNRLVDSQILSAEQQVVKGVKYRFTVQLSASSCINNGSSMGHTSAKCPVDVNSMMIKNTWQGECIYVALEDPKTTVLSVNMFVAVYIVAALALLLVDIMAEL